MAQKKRKKRKVFLSFLMILFCGVVLSTSTYAWFTANTTVTVQDITVNVATSSGIQISVNAIDWKTLITNEDIVGASSNGYSAAVNQLPASTNTINPVSTTLTNDSYDTSTGFMKFYAGQIESSTATATLGQNILVAAASPQQNGTSGDYVAFDMFLSVTTATPVYFTSNTRVTASGTSSGIENAARVAFVIEGNATAGTAAGTIQGLHGGTPSTTTLWEPNYDAHTATGISNNNSVYSSQNGVTLQSTATSGAARLPYYGVKAAIPANTNTLLDSTSATYFAAVTPTFYTTKSGGIPSNNYQSWTTLQAGVTKVRVYMWIEGQDVDCENNASGGSLTYSVQISVNENAG